MSRHPIRHAKGVTLVELLIVVALVAIILVVAAPSFKRMIEMQRLRSINSQLTTDLQFARTEAATRAARVKVNFRVNATMTCYSIYTYVLDNVNCNCLNDPPCAAAGAGYTEIKTVRLPTNNGVRVFPLVVAGQGNTFAFEPLAGALYKFTVDAVTPPPPEYTIRTWIDASRELRTIVGISGRPTICAPAGSTVQEAACP